MAQSTPTIKLIGVNDVAECRRITAAWLAAGEPIAVDAEGLNLGASGPLTLLQVCTQDGNVTMFDVINPSNLEDRRAGKRLVADGGVKAILESTSLLKISHGCHADCGALFHQFDINVQNVFDTQAAHLAIEYAEGKQFPDMRRLDELAESYIGIELDSKNFKDEWLKDRFMFWGRRPLSPQAMDYAAGDVKLLHSLFDAMKRKMDGLEECQQIYELFLDLEMNEQREEQRVAERSDVFRKQRMEHVFREIQAVPVSGDKLNDDEKGAIRAFHILVSKGTVKETDLPRNMQILERKLVSEFENDLVTFQTGSKSNFDDIDWRPMFAMKNHSNTELSDRTKKVYNQLKVLQAKCEIKELNIRITNGIVIGLDDLKASDFETIHLFREFRDELADDACITPMIAKLEIDLHKKELLELETLQRNGQLGYAVSPSLHYRIRNLCRHPDQDIRNRAQRLSKVVAVLKVKCEIKTLTRKYSNRPVCLANLNFNEKRTIQTYRQFKKSMSPEDHHVQIIALEHELNDQDLSTFEQWMRSGQLSAKAGYVEKAIIRTLTEHDDPSVRARATTLNRDFRPQHRSANVRGRQQQRGANVRGRRW